MYIFHKWIILLSTGTGTDIVAAGTGAVSVVDSISVGDGVSVGLSDAVVVVVGVGGGVAGSLGLGGGPAVGVAGGHRHIGGRGT